MKPKVIIGSRGSPLALWQAEWVRAKVREWDARIEVDIRKIKTTGDKILDAPLAKIGEKGLFVKEIEEALFAGQIDLAVHSMKDLPTELPSGLVLGAVIAREEPWDALVSAEGQTFHRLRMGARIGTSSLRRQAQFLHLRPDLDIVSLRGNLGTRLGKLSSEGLDGIVVAVAGLVRMGWQGRITEILHRQVCLPAVGQGALGIEVRQDSLEELPFLPALDHPPTRRAVSAERGFLRGLGGGCQVPIAALGEMKGDRLWLEGLVCDVRGEKLIRDTIQGEGQEAEALGMQLAGRVLEQGADAILTVNG